MDFDRNKRPVAGWLVHWVLVRQSVGRWEKELAGRLAPFWVLVVFGAGIIVLIWGGEKDVVKIGVKKCREKKKVYER